MIITLTPNPSIDRTYEIPVLVPGEVHRTTRLHQEPSGKGVNVTRALTVNGIASVAVLPSGGAAGSELAGLLDDEKVSYRAVLVSGPVRINISLTEPGGRTTKINEAGPALTPRELEQLTESALAAAGPGDWIVCSGRLPPGAPRTITHALASARTGRACVSRSIPAVKPWKPGWPPRPMSLSRTSASWPALRASRSQPWGRRLPAPGSC